MCPEKATQTPTETVRILVVDDEILIRESLAECLCGEGFEATVAASAEQAMELTAKSAFDIFTCPAKTDFNYWIIWAESVLKPM